MSYASSGQSRPSKNPVQQRHNSAGSAQDKLNSVRNTSEPSQKSQHSSKACIADAESQNSLGKRVKHKLAEDERTSPAAKRTMRAEERFNFSSPTSRRTSGVIDLTLDAHDETPRKRKPLISGAAKAGPRLIVINNRKRASAPDPNEYYNRVWEQLDAALKAIFAQEKLPYSMEELYKGVEIACRQDRAAPLYKKLCERCSSHISVNVKSSLLENAGSGSNVDTLDAVVQAWSLWKKQLEDIRSIFYYLDRSYLLHSALLPSLDEMGKAEFRTHVFLAPDLKSKMLEGVCDLLRADREGSQDSTEKALFRDTIAMFHALLVYSKHFEPKLLAASEQYFLTWANHAASTRDLAGYIEQCGLTMDQELTRCYQYGLDQTTMKGLEEYLEDILIDQRQAQLTNVDDIGVILSQDRPDVLAKLFTLLQRRRLGEKLRPAFEAYIVKQGSEIVFDEAREQEMVIRLLEFKRKLDSIWENSFQRHEGLGHILREAFESFINKSKRSNMTWGTDNPKPGEMIAKYVDMVLKGGTKAIRTSAGGQAAPSKVPAQEDAESSSEDEDVEISKQLDQVLDLFRFVHGKAVFEAFYKRDLARRLLLGRSASADSEKSMLTRLKSGMYRAIHLHRY